MFKIENIPNILALMRILIIPVIIIFLEIDGEFYNWLALILYIIACLSDFLDGYLARKFYLESSFGRFLDPVADKILIVSLIFILISNSIISGIFIYPALIIVIREMFSLGFLMVSNNFNTNLMLLIGNFGLAVASIMTIHTGYIYFKKNLRLFK